MPSKYSSQHSQDDAADLAQRTGLHFRSVAIASVVEAFQPNFTSPELPKRTCRLGCVEPRLMGISNQEGHLVLAPETRASYPSGYSTLYGDAVGGYAPLKDVPKTAGLATRPLAKRLGISQGQTPPIPPNSIEKPPSAELRPDQLDTDSLPPYDVLDDVLDDYVEQDHGASDLVATGFDAALVDKVLRLTDRAEFKRRQYPPGPKISFKAFGRDRRLPITSKWREYPLRRTERAPMTQPSARPELDRALAHTARALPRHRWHAGRVRVTSGPGEGDPEPYRAAAGRLHRLGRRTRLAFRQIIGRHRPGLLTLATPRGGRARRGSAWPRWAGDLLSARRGVRRGCAKPATR